jgi:molybdopterin-guanine dinucleotide biosynthesis protein A
MTEHTSKSGITCSAVILAGGLNSRMGGRNKALLTIGGKRIVDCIVDALDPLFEEIMLVTRLPELYRDTSLHVVEDLLKVRSSLTGIHAGLTHARADYIFVVPCDAPFLQTDLIRLILDEVEPRYDVVLPRCGEFYQPLCAVYSKRCLAFIEEMLNQGDLKILNLFDKINLKEIPMEKLIQADPEERSFINVNTPEIYRLYKSHVFIKQS